MSLENLLLSLKEYLEAKNESSNGFLLESKKKFAQALNEYIDWRAEGVLEDRVKRISTERSVLVADLLLPALKIDSLTALNSAPNPPSDTANLKAWIENYRKWYDGDRKKGLG